VPSSVHIDSGRTWGGGQEQSLGLALALAERGESTHFIAQTGSALAERLRTVTCAAEAGPVPSRLVWEAIPLRGLVGAAHSLPLHRCFSQLRPEIVHIHDSAAQVPALLAISGMGRPRPRVIVTRRTDVAVGGPLRTFLYRRLCDRVICVSQAVRQRMLDAHVPAKLLWVIPDFVDCRHFDPAAVTTEREPRPTVLSVGRMTREKGHTVLVRAMLIVAKAIPEVRLLVCGQGEREADLKKQTETEGLSEAVTFLGFAPDVRPSLNASDVFVMPSLSEGLGVAAIEAMAMAKPVVASRVGGLPESVVDGETGLLVPPGDGPALAAAIIALLRNSDLAQAMGRAGRQRALAQFDRGRVLDRVLALYHEVMAEG